MRGRREAAGGARGAVGVGVKRLAGNAACVCGSGRKARACCLPLHEGAAAASPEALMRSRYAAYACARVGYLVATTHPDSPHRRADARAWAEELRAYCAALDCDGLTVHEAGLDADGGYVSFTARLRLGGQDVSFRERSRFRQVDGRWLYLDGVVEAA